MPFIVNHSTDCVGCPHGTCFEDLRGAPIRGRDTLFRFRQEAAMHCTFCDFMPGTSSDPLPNRSYSDYLPQFTDNAYQAGKLLFGPAFNIKKQAIGKVEGDVFELLEAGALWAAAAAWNRYMDTGTWASTSFTCPPGAIATPSRKVAIVKLPRNYDATLLFKDSVRARILAHDHALQCEDMELGLSSPDTCTCPSALDTWPRKFSTIYPASHTKPIAEKGRFIAANSNTNYHTS